MISINSKYPEMVFKNEVSGYTHYTIGLSNKKQDGTYENGYINCRFKKDVELENKSKIIIKNGFISFYKTKNNDTVPLLFITEFDKEYHRQEEVKTEPIEETDPYSQIGLEIEDEDLPF